MFEIGIIVVGLVQCLKMAGLDSRWLPLLSVFFGILLTSSPYFFSPYETLLHAILEGAMVGLTATGLINRIDNTAEKIGTTTIKEAAGHTETVTTSKSVEVKLPEKVEKIEKEDI